MYIFVVDWTVLVVFVIMFLLEVGYSTRQSKIIIICDKKSFKFYLIDAKNCVIYHLISFHNLTTGRAYL